MNDIWLKIKEYNLDTYDVKGSFVKKLMEENGWNESFAYDSVEEYRKFMFLLATSEQFMSPSKIVDKVWHQHILDTKAYAKFCDDIHGTFIHHVPRRSNQSDDEFIDSYNRTINQYQKIFKDSFRVSSIIQSFLLLLFLGIILLCNHFYCYYF